MNEGFAAFVPLIDSGIYIAASGQSEAYHARRADPLRQKSSRLLVVAIPGACSPELPLEVFSDRGIHAQVIPMDYA